MFEHESLKQSLILESSNQFEWKKGWESSSNRKSSKEKAPVKQSRISYNWKSSKEIQSKGVIRKLNTQIFTSTILNLF